MIWVNKIFLCIVTIYALFFLVVFSMVANLPFSHIKKNILIKGNLLND